jgi:hypothetical protein
MTEPTGSREGRVRTCKKRTFDSRLAARTRLLELWAHRNFKLDHTYFCPVHQGWHLTTKKSNGGRNPDYKN